MTNSEMARHSRRCQRVAGLLVVVGLLSLVSCIYQSFGWGILGSLFLIFITSIIWQHYREVRDYYESLLPPLSQVNKETSS